MTAISDLIARLEAAKEGSRELDAEICLTLRMGFSQQSYNNWTGLQPKGRGSKEYDFALIVAPKFTTSLDAALTLKRTAGYTIIEFCNGSGFQIEVDDEMADARTAPLGICICILKAREAGR